MSRINGFFFYAAFSSAHTLPVSSSSSLSPSRFLCTLYLSLPLPLSLCIVSCKHCSNKCHTSGEQIPLFSLLSVCVPAAHFNISPSHLVQRVTLRDTSAVHSANCTIRINNITLPVYCCIRCVCVCRSPGNVRVTCLICFAMTTVGESLWQMTSVQAVAKSQYIVLKRHPSHWSLDSRVLTPFSLECRVWCATRVARPSVTVCVCV